MLVSGVLPGDAHSNSSLLDTRKKSFGQQCLQAVLRRLPDLLRALRPFLLEQQSEPVDRIEFFSIKLPR